jgi:uncharacterized protein (TIGR00251 family)
MEVRVKVIPKRTRSEVVGALPDGTLKVRVAAPPERGKANAELCRTLARHFQVAVSRVRILRGLRSANKVIVID